MSKTLFNFWLDVVLLLLFTTLSLVNGLLYLVFPPGPFAAGWELWGLSYSQWHTTQFVLFCTFAAAVLLHVMWHWKWVCSVVVSRVLNTKSKPDDGIRTLYGVGLLIVLLTGLAVALIVASLTIVQPSS